MKLSTVVGLAAALATAGLPAAAATYDIDPVHSEVGFKVRHMMVGKTAGKFTGFSGAFEYDGKDPKTWSAKANIDAGTIDTGNAKRDAHLKSPDFFDVQKFPSLSFASTAVKDWKEGKGKLLGKLTMHGVTKDVALDLELGGETPGGAGFTARGKVDRRDFGIVWNKALDQGGVAVGNDIEIVIEVEGQRRKS